MENNEVKNVCIKNRMCYYFDHITKLEEFDGNNILIDQKSHENILFYDMSYETLIRPKPFPIRFDKIDGFIRTYDGNIYETLFGSGKHDAIYRYLISIKSCITYICSHYFTKIKDDSYDSLPIKEKISFA